MPKFQSNINIEDDLKKKHFDGKLFVRMLKYLLPYYKAVIIAFICIGGLTLIELALPFIMKTITDDFVISDKELVVTDNTNLIKTLTAGVKEHYEYNNHSYFLVRTDEKAKLPEDIVSKLKPAKKVYQIKNDAKNIEILGKTKFWQLNKTTLAVCKDDVKKLNLSIEKKQTVFSMAIDGIVKFGALYLILVLLRFVFTYAQLYTIAWFSQRAMYDLRNNVFRHLLKMPAKFFDTNPIGRLVTRSTNDIQSLNEMLSSGFISLFQDILVLIGIVITMLALNWKLTLISYTILPFLIIATRIFMKKMRVIYREVRKTLAQINARISEDISGMKIIQLFNLYSYKQKQFDDINNKYYKTTIRQMYIFAFFRPLISNTRFIAMAVILWYAGGQILENALSVGMFLAFIRYMERFYEPINRLSERFNVLQGAMAGAERIFDLLDQDPADYRDNLIENKKLDGEIELENLWLAYNDDEYVLKNINLKIKPGEKVALVGHTGSGKTSIVNLILGMYPYQKGELFLDGKSLKSYALSDIRNNVGMVQQDVFLFSGTIAENISLNDETLSKEKIIQAAKDVDVFDFIDSLPGKFDEPVMERGATLSVGQRQLIAFARVLAYNPSIFILDEATSNIDTETELHIQKALEVVTKNRTSIIIAHRLSTIQHADRIVVLHKGEIMEQGNHQELLAKKGLYYDLYRLQYK